MWLSRTQIGRYIVHKTQPLKTVNVCYSVINNKEVLDTIWYNDDAQYEIIPQWLAIEICNKYQVDSPKFSEGPIELLTHKSRMYSFSWWILLTREWGDLKACLK
jgi:hypothetical protein